MSDHQPGGGLVPPPQALDIAAVPQTVRLQQVLTATGTQNVNVITTRGQQFVFTSQVGMPGIQQAGMTHILNISPSSRLNVVGMKQTPGRSNGSGGDSLPPFPTVSLVSISQPSAVNASSHPTLVSSLSTPPRTRTVGSISEVQSPTLSLVPANVTPNHMRLSGLGNSHSLISANQPRKRVKLMDAIDGASGQALSIPSELCQYKLSRKRSHCERYAETAAELFFLQADGNMMDYHVWRKRAATAPFLHFLRTHRLDPEDDDEDLTILLSVNVPYVQAAHPEIKVDGGRATPVAISTTLPPAVAQLNQQGGTPLVPESLPVTPANTCSRIPPTPTLSTSPNKVTKLPLISPLSRQHTRQHSISAVYDTSFGSQEQIAEKAKQEASVVQRVVDLQKVGLWGEKRLPKLQEPPRAKAHWDYLLEEMVWLAADFAQERKWKKAAAKKCARNIQKYFQEKVVQAKKEEKLQELQLRKIASIIAKEVKVFWSNAEKIVEHKQRTRLEEKRKQALDQHLSFIVDQTEKYSTWLAESMNKTGIEAPNTSVPTSVASSQISSPSRQDAFVDDEFEPNLSSTDDEETIAKAEEDMGTADNINEIEMLKQESELPIEDLLKRLQGANQVKDPVQGEDVEFKASDGEITDDEDTIMEQENAEGNVDHKKEIAVLRAENEMNIDELMAKYGGTGAVDYGNEDLDSDDDKMESDSEDDDSEDEESYTEEDEMDDEEMGLKSLMDDGSGLSTAGDNEAAGKEINDVAALAESIQPKGNTLSSTNVVTPIPFLLKHNLREYQHIGLDWLVTMFDRKLNGILADEMGLGKTIQTIALLAHLACEKGNWGPHLIIVPTSVMLNWEMEFKKWCPAFKILTYYGTQKERKLKRTGWTKPNAFHICITSYKLVIQDHQSFRRKKWKYLILDEAQNIKNFKSQRWQLLLNFQTQRRLLLTGTPLQNNLMELWSLMHFLMPNVFQSHREFKEWFSNPVTGMIEGNSEYNETIIKRLHKVLRPFLLRRLKCEVEKQLPKKYEHVVMCRLSKRQRYLYDDFMSRAKTRETLATGNLLSVINVLMQLRKVCNHPNLFEVRPTTSPFQMEGITYHTASMVWSALEYDFRKHVSLFFMNFLLLELEASGLSAYSAHYGREYQTPRKLVEEIDRISEPPPPCPRGRFKFYVRDHSTNAVLEGLSDAKQNVQAKSPHKGGVTLQVTGGTQLQGVSVQLVQHKGSLKAIPVATLGASQQSPAPTNQQTVSSFSLKPADGVQTMSMPAGFAQIVQTTTGRRLLLSSLPQVMQPLAAIPVTSTGFTVSGSQKVTVLPKCPPTPGNRLAAPQTPSRSAVRNVVQSTLPASIINALVSGSCTTATPTTTALTQPMLAALVQQARNNSTLAAGGSVTRNDVKLAEQLKQKSSLARVAQSRFYLGKLDECKRLARREKLMSIHNINETRCQAYPLYGEDTRRYLDVVTSRLGTCQTLVPSACTSSSKPQAYWSQTSALDAAICTPLHYIEQLKDIFARFVLCVPAVSAPHPSFHVSHPPPSRFWQLKRSQAMVQQELSSRCALLHPIESAMVTQFPDPRLIQYDCGKLQVLDGLLRRLKGGHHRVLIFTQMTRMLDVLEAFLNFHGHIYLRLDGTTKVDQRQLLMERFNADKRIFVFILSTRSGGIGVNLTGADTVVFYDSDWNPTMDAQAQDRCHRIGQTRDVHIYRLVSEMTVEENILKKANQKRLLGDLAIEGGNFTTAYFKSTTIQDLFNIDASENNASRRMAEVLDTASDQAALPPPPEEKTALGALETALAAAEDDSDVLAARTARAEAAAELAEFDENIPLEDPEAAVGEPEMSKAEQEVKNLIQMLSPVERYAMKLIEQTESAWSAEQLAAAEAEIENQKREWEVGRLKALHDEEERQARLAEDDGLLTYSRDDAQNQVWVSDNALEQMPMWCPPTPPPDDNDVYIDYSVAFLYEQSVMSESQLPPVYVKRDRKRMRSEITPLSEREGRRPSKIRHKEESFYAPKSLFDRPSTAVLKMRRDMKLQKCRGIIRPPMSQPGVKPPTPGKPFAEPENVPDWIINEDWAILQTIQTLLGLPLNLMVISPGHTPNWDFVSEIVNGVSVIYRSPKQCRNRYESVIVPREEGKVLFDANPKKLKKTKGIYKVQQQTKTNRPMRTSQLNLQDNNLTRSRMFVNQFEATRVVSSKRTPTVKSLIVNPTLNNPKHAAVLAECGIDYENPAPPSDVATMRAERIAKEKQKSALQASAVLSAEQQLTTQRLQQQQQQAAQAVAAKSVPSIPSSMLQATASINPLQLAQQQPPPQLAQQQQVASVVSIATTAMPAAVATSVQAVVRPRLIQEMVGGNQIRVASASGTPTMVSVANLTPMQMQAAAQRLVSQSQTPVTVVTTKGVAGGTVTTTGGKPLTASQMQYLRQQQLIRQQQQRNLRDQQLKSLQANQPGGQKMTVSVTAANTLNVATVQVAPAQQQRTQFIKQTTAGGKQVTRPVTEAEMAALLKRQQQITQKVQAQMHPGQTVPGQPQIGTLVKAAGGSALPQVKTSLPVGMKTATPAQIRQLQLHQQMLQQRKMVGQKVAHVAQVSGKGGQLLVQAPKPPTMTFQQLNQVIRQVAPQHITHVSGGKPMTQTSSGQLISHAVLSRASSQGGQTRVIPMQQQTIQVVTAQTGGIRTSVPNVTIDAAGRPQVTVASTLASALAGSIKVGPTVATTQHQAMLSQVTAALQGSPLSVRPNPIRGGPPLIAVTIQQQAQGAPTVVTAQQVLPRPATPSTQQEPQPRPHT